MRPSIDPFDPISYTNPLVEYPSAFDLESKQKRRADAVCPLLL